MGVLNEKCRINNTEIYSVDFGVLSLSLSAFSWFITNWFDLSDQKKVRTEQRIVALEKVTSKQGRLMAEMKTDINGLKTDISGLKESILKIKEMLQDIKKGDRMSEG